MNRFHALIAAAWTLAGVVSLGAIWGWATAVPLVPREQRKAYQAAAPVAPGDTTGLVAAAAMLRDHDPFRFERKPTKLRFNPWEPAIAAVPPRAPQRPALGLMGLVGGPPWNAVIQGIPGREAGVVLSVGDSVSGVRLDRIHGDTVFVSGLDTTWILVAGRLAR